MGTSIFAAALVGAALAAVGCGVAAAEPAAGYTLTIKDHRFEPTELKVPAGKLLTLTVKNLDATPEEFESHELKVEKIVAGGKDITVRLGPLEPGRYSFFGEFNESTAKGTLVVE